MKKFIAMIMMLLPISAFASIPEIEKLLNDYSATENVTVVNLSGEMLKMAIEQSGEGEIGESLESLCVLNTEDAEHSKDITKRVDKILKRANLESVTDIEAEGAHVRILMSKESDMVSDLVVYVTEGSEVALVVISGEIPESMIGELTNSLKNL